MSKVPKDEERPFDKPEFGSGSSAVTGKEELGSSGIAADRIPEVESTASRLAHATGVGETAYQRAFGTPFGKVSYRTNQVKDLPNERMVFELSKVASLPILPEETPMDVVTIGMEDIKFD